MDPFTMSAVAGAVGGGGGGGLPGMPSLDGMTGGNAGPSNAQSGDYTNSLDFSYTPPNRDLPPWLWLGLAAVAAAVYIAAKK